MLCVRCRREIPDGSAFCNLCGKRQPAVAPSPQRRARRRPKGAGSVCKLSGTRAKPWAARAADRSLIGTYASPGEAVLALDTYNAKCLPTDRRRYTLRQVYASLQRSPRWGKLSVKGREGLEIAWQRLEPLADRPALSIAITEYQDIIDKAMLVPRYKKLSPEELAGLPPSRRKRYEALAAQPPQPLGYDGKNRIRQLVSHLYAEMIRLEISTQNMADQLVLPEQPTSFKRNFTRAEERLLKQHDDLDDVKIILIYLRTGMRLGELLTLPRSHVDLQNRVITGGSKTKAGRNRRIPILDDILPYVQYYYDKGGELLIEENGAPMTEDHFRRHHFYPTLAKSGIQYQDDGGRNLLTPHRTRHTAAAHAIQSGVDPVALAKVLGHAKFATTVDKYGDDLDINYLRREMEKTSSK